MVIFLFIVKKGSDNAKKIRRISKEEIKQQLIDYLINSDKIETEELNEKTDKVEKYEDAATIVKSTKKQYIQKNHFYASRIIKEKFLEDSKRRKSSSN